MCVLRRGIGTLSASGGRGFNSGNIVVVESGIIFIYTFQEELVALTIKIFIFLFLDTDECATNTYNCSHNCNNTMGGYNCSCPGGLYLDDGGRRCLGEVGRFVGQ